MKTVIRLVFFILTFTLLFTLHSFNEGELFHFNTLAFASSEFSTSHDVTYEALSSGSLLVTQNVNLTNKLSNIYASQYSFTLERGQLENIKAFDSHGLIETKMKKDDEKTTITLVFADQVVGKNQSRQFTLQYEANNLIQKSGQVWEITLPKINNSEEITSYTANLKVPLSLGKPAYISPSPKSQRVEGDYQTFSFTKDQISQSGVAAAFGEFQVFDFSLSYHLYNPNLKQMMAKIAFPPDTNYQKLSYKNIAPAPENIEIDKDGNWLGIYKLRAQEEVEIKAEGKAKIFAKPQNGIVSYQKDENDLEKYLKPQKYWEVDDPEIRALAQKSKTPKAIHDYVVKTLQYDYSRVREGTYRFGASDALKKPDRSICMEYTDLFIAIARAAGIPARELNGFAYTSNPVLQPLSLAQDILHAWPEYWDKEKKAWVQIDPTWENTTGGIDYFSKLDLGHFVFTIHGQDSQTPAPAGAYKVKKDGRFQKDVQIEFGKYEESAKQELNVTFMFPDKILSETLTEGKIRIKNDGWEAVYSLGLNLEAPDFSLRSDRNFIIESLPPFSSIEIPVKLVRQQIFSSGVGKLTLLVNSQRFNYDLPYESLALSYLLPLIGGTLGFLAVLILVRKTIDWYFKRSE